MYQYIYSTLIATLLYKGVIMQLSSAIVDCSQTFQRKISVGREGGVHNLVKVLVKVSFSDNNSDVFELN